MSAALIQSFAIVYGAAMTGVATVLTGISALAAAWWVGKKQFKILSRQADIQAEQSKISAAQNEILAGQLRLDQHRAKADLFAQRLQVYSAARAWLRAFMTDAEAPTGQVRSDYIEAMDRAAFLFRPEVEAWLREKFDAAARHQIQIRRLMGPNHDPGVDHAELAAIELNAINAGLRGLNEVFAPDMGLGGAAL